MCGICGTAGFVNKGLLAQMCKVMRHRGPNDEGFFVDEEAKIGLAMRRLSIIDLDTGHQPIHNEDRSLWVVCNGEVYNYPALRESLERRGHQFRTSTDTESIIHLYEEHGEKCVNYLRGMFAFALWDSKTAKLLVARDRLGIKPLYYTFQYGELIFASEIKALLEWDGISRDVDFEALDSYLTWQYIPAPLTIFRSVRKLLPGHCLIYKHGEVEQKRYWQLNSVSQTEIPDEELPGLFLETLREAVELRLVSDVPLGAFLSGGIDSSTVVALMSMLSNEPVKTFSVGFAGWKEGDELGYAREAATCFGCEHHEITVEPDIAGLLHRVVWHLDEPLADPAAIPTFLISEFASEYVTVVLTGEGADELCAGYKQYAWDRFAPYFHLLPAGVRDACCQSVSRLPGLKRVKKGLESLCVVSSDVRRLNWTSVFSPELKTRLYTDQLQRCLSGWNPLTPFYPHFSDWRGEASLNQWLYVDTKVWLPDDLLMKVDKMSMAASIEARVPYLDHELVEFAAAIPSRLKLKGFVSKYVLKKATSGILPESVIKRKKHGFNLPLDRWFRNELGDFVSEILFDPISMGRGYFEPKGVRWLVEEHLRGANDYSRQMYVLLVLELWHRTFCDTS
jgi:asparagine synthase (glutamine-hydrolysing)